VLVQLVSEFCKLDLTCPVPGCAQQETRILLLEGALKLKDKDSKVCVRHCSAAALISGITSLACPFVCLFVR